MTTILKHNRGLLSKEAYNFLYRIVVPINKVEETNTCVYTYTHMWACLYVFT